MSRIGLRNILTSHWYLALHTYVSMQELPSERKMVLISERAYHHLCGGLHEAQAQDHRLSVIDDQPRDDFSPRQLHTLKEFAVRSSSLLR